MTCAMVILIYKDCLRARMLAEKCATYDIIEKIVIVDNCSGDGSFEYLSEISNEKIHIMLSDKNGGFGYGNNVGAKYLLENYNPQYILLANTDTIFPEENIVKCIEVLENDSSLGMTSTRMKNPNGEEQKSSWKFASFKEHLLTCFWAYRRKKYVKAQKTSVTYAQQVVYVDVVRGSFMLFRSEALEKAGFFDENVFLYAEEVIIASRLQKAGYKAGVMTDVWYIHDHHDVVKTTKGYHSLKRLMKSAYYYQCNYRNINQFQKMLMSICMLWGGFEQKVIDIIKS